VKLDAGLIVDLALQAETVEGAQVLDPRDEAGVGATPAAPGGEHIVKCGGGG
jgi:hypothetical protein